MSTFSSKKKVFSWIIFLLSIGASILGIVYAVCSKNMGYGGRGGAIGTAIALGFMFLSRNDGFQIYKLLTQRMPQLKSRIDRIVAGKEVPLAPITSEAVQQNLEYLVAAIERDGHEQGQVNTLMAIATFISTLIWGFGDVIACHILHPH